MDKRCVCNYNVLSGLAFRDFFRGWFIRNRFIMLSSSVLFSASRGLRAVVFAVCLSFFGSLVFLGSSLSYADENEDISNIRHRIQRQWQTPEQTVEVSPVAIAKPYALAGWQQGQRGGHALLQFNGAEWQVLFCGGEALTSRSALIKSGLTSAQAQALIQAWERQTSQLSSDVRHKLNAFEGIVPVSDHPQPTHH